MWFDLTEKPRALDWLFHPLRSWRRRDDRTWLHIPDEPNRIFDALKAPQKPDGDRPMFKGAVGSLRGVRFRG